MIYKIALNIQSKKYIWEYVRYFFFKIYTQKMLLEYPSQTSGLLD